MTELNPELKQYIDESVLPRYAHNIGGHGIDHIQQVIRRSFEIAEAFQLPVDANKVYTIAAYHDIGYPVNADEHEAVSAQMFLEDEGLQAFFSEEERTMMAEAIVDHRASLEYEARSIYGKIVSSADRETSVRNMLERSFLYQSDKHKEEMPTVSEVINYSYKKLSSKYGKCGYAKMYYPDKKYKEYLETMQDLLENKDKFVQEEMKIAKELGRL